MRLFRASILPRSKFDPLDSSRSIARDGWRFNDSKTELLYAAAVQSLALLEVVVRPGWESVQQVTVATIEVPDDAVVDLAQLGITLPTNWNARPVARDSQSIGAEFLSAIDARTAPPVPGIVGVLVPSVISTTDYNVLLDPRRKTDYKVVNWARIPFETLRTTAT